MNEEVSEMVLQKTTKTVTNTNKIHLKGTHEETHAISGVFVSKLHIVYITWYLFVCSDHRQYSIRRLEMTTFSRTFSDDGIFGSAC
jgi:hypothetical protein